MPPVGSRGKTPDQGVRGRSSPEAESNLKIKWAILRSGFDYLTFWCFRVFSPLLACIARRKCNFLRRLMSSDNLACQLCHNYASADYLYWSHVMDDLI